MNNPNRAITTVSESDRSPVSTGTVTYQTLPVPSGRYSVVFAGNGVSRVAGQSSSEMCCWLTARSAAAAWSVASRVRSTSGPYNPSSQRRGVSPCCVRATRSRATRGCWYCCAATAGSKPGAACASGATRPMPIPVTIVSSPPATQ
ncbi:hypothetical protein GCM10023321_50480 [Pseudonocardia eucalypti]|uniref:Uncharacterized protein n=1 Tax=Pseudonocardia eucalypti TaxID=648755 RepID=A0ABP9QKH3_9PSEU